MGKVNNLITYFMIYNKKVFHVTAAIARLRFFYLDNSLSSIHIFKTNSYTN